MPVDAAQRPYRMVPPPWGEGLLRGYRVEWADQAACEAPEQTIRSRVLQVLMAHGDPVAELALWGMPAGDGPDSLSTWLAWWAFQRPIHLRARIDGYTLHGPDVLQAVNEITRSEASAPPLVSTFGHVRGVRQDVVRYEWHGLEPLMFIRAPGHAAPDLWKQLDAWPVAQDPPAPDVLPEVQAVFGMTREERETMNEAHAASPGVKPVEPRPEPAYRAKGDATINEGGGQAAGVSSTTTGAPREAAGETKVMPPATASTELAADVVDLFCPKCGERIRVRCGPETAFPREQKCLACSGWARVVRKDGVVSIEGNPLAAAMPAPAPMPDWFGKEPPKVKKKRAPKAKPSAEQEADHGGE